MLTIFSKPQIFPKPIWACLGSLTDDDAHARASIDHLKYLNFHAEGGGDCVGANSVKEESLTVEVFIFILAVYPLQYFEPPPLLS